MKNTLVLLLPCTLLLSTLKAQRVSRDYRDRPMTEVLADLSRATTRQRIIFIHNDLEDFTITQRFDSLSVADAIRVCIGHYPITMTNQGDSILLVECVQKKPYKVIGRLVDEKDNPIADANITLIADTIVTGRGISNQNGRFVIHTDHSEGTLQISHIAYQPVSSHYLTGNMGTIRLKTANIKLDSVSISKSRPGRFERKYRKTEAEIWSMDLPHFDLDTIPEKYRDAPAVVLAEYDSVVYRREQWMMPILPLIILYPDPLGLFKRVNTTRLHRTRIFINSEEAARELSQFQHDFYFRCFLISSREKIVWGIRITKPDGTVRTLDTYQFFYGNNNFNDSIISLGGITRRYLDAGPLQPGDIIDFFEYKKKTGPEDHLYSFQKRYPTLHLDYNILTNRRLCVEYNRQNDAPDFHIQRQDNHYLMTYSACDIAGCQQEQPPQTQLSVNVKSVGMLDNLWDKWWSTKEERESRKSRRHGITDMTKQNMEE